MDRTEFTRVRGNIAKLYVFSFFQMFIVVMPVIVPFFQSKGLNLQQIFTLQGIFGATLIVCDTPAGYLADLFGRRITLVAGSIVSALGFQILCFGQTYNHFLLYELVIGVGLSLQSGCDVAILYDSLAKLRLRGSRAGYLGRRLTYQTAGEGMASLLGGFLAGLSLRLPAVAMAVTSWIPVLIALLLVEPSGAKLSRKSHLQNLQTIGRATFGHSKVLTFAMIAFIFYGFGTFVAVWSLQPYWQARGLSFHLFGYLWAANNFLVAFIARYAHLVEKRLGSANIVIIVAALPVIGYLGMGFTPGLFGLIFTLTFPICRALNQVILQDAINYRVPGEIRATVNSVATLGMRALFVIFGPIIGAVLDRTGPDGAMQMLGWVYAAGIVVVALPLLSQRHNFRA